MKCHTNITIIPDVAVVKIRWALLKVKYPQNLVRADKMLKPTFENVSKRKLIISDPGKKGPQLFNTKRLNGSRNFWSNLTPENKFTSMTTYTAKLLFH